MMNCKKIMATRKMILFSMCVFMVVCISQLQSTTFANAEINDNTTEIYLNGRTGSDSNDGSTITDAVKTFEKAKDIATQYPNIKTIYITNTVNISSDISLNGTNAIIKRHESFGGNLMYVTSSSTATLSDITIDGNSENSTSITSPLIRSAGTLNIKDGTVLQNNVLTDLGYFRALGGAIATEAGNGDSVINMSGGLIQNNSANFGGGIYLAYATLNMTGGTIQNNKAVDSTTTSTAGYGAGGGVAVYNGSTFNLSGNAVIQNNSSDNLGGGISVGIGGTSNGMDTLNMSGGTVTNNSAGSGGGGIFVQAGLSNKYGTATISGGNITNNTMTGTGTGNKSFGGGGIYVNGYSNYISGYHNGVLNLTNALVEENTASMEGGGYASCPNSNTNINVKNGVAILNNHANGGNEIYILASNAYGTHSGDPIYSISPYMLGGTPYNWKFDNDTEVPQNTLEGQLWAIYNQSLSLHTDVTSDSNAQSLAKVLITGNSSTTRGGGIGSNGTVVMGMYDTISIDVTKNWNVNEQDEIPDFIKVDIYRTDSSSTTPTYVGFENIWPDNNNNWSTTISNLPKSNDKGEPYTYTVKERAIEGFVAQVTGDQDSGFTITNERAPEKTSVSVVKKWDDNNDTDKIRPNSVVIHLTADGVDTQKTLVLSEDNNWTASFEDLNVYDTNKNIITYEALEDAVEGYTTAITKDGENNSFIVTNTHTPNTTDPNTPNTLTKLSKPNFPQTGDSSSIEFCFVVMALSLTTATASLFLVRKCNKPIKIG